MRSAAVVILEPAPHPSSPLPVPSSRRQSPTAEPSRSRNQAFSGSHSSPGEVCLPEEGQDVIVALVPAHLLQGRKCGQEMGGSPSFIHPLQQGGGCALRVALIRTKASLNILALLASQKVLSLPTDLTWHSATKPDTG